MNEVKVYKNSNMTSNKNSNKTSNNNSLPTLGRLITLANSYSNKEKKGTKDNNSNTSHTSHSHNNLKVHMLNS